MTRLASQLVPRLFINAVVCFLLYLAMSKLGQVADLLRAVNANLVQHFFLTLAFAGLTGFCLALCLDGAGSGDPAAAPSATGLVVRLLAGASAPAMLALQTFGAPGPGSLGLWLGFTVGVLVPVGGVVKMWTERGQEPLDQRVSTIAASLCMAGLVYYVALFWSPAFWGMLMGPVATLFAVSVALLWTAWFLVRRTPVVLVALLCVTGLAIYGGSYGVRAVRPLAGGDARPTAAAHAAQWLQARRAELSGPQPYPVFFVTSDGGGIRSSYWTATLLGALNDDNPAFARHTYLMSGVSGGSLGVAVVAAQIADAAAVARNGGFNATARAVLSRDFLAAPVAQLLTRDPVESVLCLGWGWQPACSTPPFDRIVAMETVMEGSWNAALGSNRFSDSLSALWQGDRQWQVPALLLNTTEAHSGEPRVLSSMAYSGTFGPREDVLAAMPRGQTLRLSTAALLSARFPLVSPEGELILAGKAEHLVDGGYYDNSGGASALVAFQEFTTAVRAAGLEGKVRPVAIVITNDPLRQSVDPTRSACTPLQRDAPSLKHGVIGLLSEPIGTLDAGRAAAAETHRKAWQDAVVKAGGEVRELALFQCAQDEDMEFPLGWALSPEVREHMDMKVERLRKAAGSPYRQLLEFLPPARK